MIEGYCVNAAADSLTADMKTSFDKVVFILMNLLNLIK